MCRDMDRKDRKYLSEDDLTQADRLVLEVYKHADEPAEWDGSDEAILAFARDVAEAVGQDQARSAVGVSSSEATAAGKGEAVLGSKPREQAPRRSLYRSLLGNLAMAASLLLGVLLGQGLIPYYDLGLAPGYDDLVRENERLAEESVRVRSLQVQPPQGAHEAPAGSVGTMFGQGTDLLAGFECAKLALTLSDDRQLRVSGHVSSLEDLRRLDADLSGYQAFGRMVNDVIVYDWPFCEHLALLEDMTLLRAEGPHSPAVRLAAHPAEQAEGDAFIVEAIGTSLYQGYLYVDFIRQDGQVVHLQPAGLRTGPGERRLLRLEKTAHLPDTPYGTGLLSVISTPVPLFESPRPETESVQAYYEDLRGALREIGAEGRRAELLSAYDFVTLQAGHDPSAQDR